jgi:hypothetical protein
MNEAAIQAEYETRICSRDPEKVARYFHTTRVLPNGKNLRLMLTVEDKIQECLDIRFGRDNAPIETRFWNLYVSFLDKKCNLKSKVC